MPTGGPTDVVIDTSTLINFLRIGRVDLLAGLTSDRFIVTDHVRHEVTNIYPAQLSVLEFAFLAGHLHVLSVDSTDPVFLGMKGTTWATASVRPLPPPVAWGCRWRWTTGGRGSGPSATTLGFR
jgi:hypothetical protein